MVEGRGKRRRRTTGNKREDYRRSISLITAAGNPTAPSHDTQLVCTDFASVARPELIYSPGIATSGVGGATRETRITFPKVLDRNRLIKNRVGDYATARASDSSDNKVSIGAEAIDLGEV